MPHHVLVKGICLRRILNHLCQIQKSCTKIYVGTKGVSQNHLLSFDDNKVLKSYQLDMLNICSSVQDHNQSTIHKDSE